MTGDKIAAAAASDPGPTPSGSNKTGGEGRGHHGPFFALALGAIGVVFGDIGTSPLYAFRLALLEAAKGGIHAETVLGLISMMIWALILVVTVKYVFFLMRADNKGEGGVLSLMALAQHAVGRRTTFIFLMGVVGAALFFGDSIITPAISVLSAVEGLRSVPAIAADVNVTVVIIASLVILIGLFLVQSRGTAKVAGLFGPICVLWFGTIAALGAMHMVQHPSILMAFNPLHGLKYVSSHGFTGALVLGAVFLTVTGAEALYADMGHFGRWPIQAGWLFVVFPALVLNYLGQGSLALGEIAHAAARGAQVGDMDWFFLLAPPFLRVPLVILSTLATIIASQAVITGAFSLTSQAMQLGLLPRMVVRQTSETHAGQIYLPQINFMLLAGVILLVAIFRSSEAFGQAYGFAVSGTMAVTTSLAFVVVRRQWRWPLWAAILIIAPLLTLDLFFFAANSLKILSGGFVPLLLGTALFIVMATWVRGAEILAKKTKRDSPPLADFISWMTARPPLRAKGTAVFLTSDATRAPAALLHNLKHNQVLHAQNVIMTMQTADRPFVDQAERIKVETISPDFKTVLVTYGFMETPDAPKALVLARKQGVSFDIMSTSFFVGRRTIVAPPEQGMPMWQDRLFIFLMRNAASPTDFFHIPPGRVVEMGSQVTV